MESRSMQIYALTRGAAQKFDYFVSGLTGALLAYIAQGLHPGKMSLGPELLEPLAILLLSASFFFGMKHIEYAITVSRLNQEVLDATERMEDIAKTQSFPTYNPVHNIRFANASERDAAVAKLSALADQKESQARGWIATAQVHYDRRQWLLYAGFVCLLLHRYLMPYWR